MNKQLEAKVTAGVKEICIRLGCARGRRCEVPQHRIDELASELIKAAQKGYDAGQIAAREEGMY